MDNSNTRFEDLVEEYFEGPVSDEDARELAGLMDSDPAYGKKYSELAKLRAVSMVPYFAGNRQGNYRILADRLDFHRRPAGTRRRLIIWRNIAAAVILVAAGSVLTRYLMPADGGAGTQSVFEAEAPADSKSKIRLPDGSVVWLNENSKLTLNPDFGRKNRSMQLDGEGYFDVAIDEKRQFVVNVGGIDVKALGTRFNIRGYSDQPHVITTLLEGEVEVTEKISGISKIMEANDMLTFNKSDRQMEITVRKNSLLSILWQNGVWEMNSVPLCELCRELELIYGVRIEIRNREHRNARFTGQLYVDEPIESFLKIICRTIDVRYTRTGETIIIE